MLLAVDVGNSTISVGLMDDTIYVAATNIPVFGE